VADRRPDARFYVVGEGELRESLEARMRGLGLDDRFTFTGYMSDVRTALAALDLVVFPSLWEGTPLTAFEALAAGKAIVATDADGLADILTNGRDALVVPKANGSALADAILALAADPARRGELAHRAAETGREYDIGSFVRKMERLYVILHETSRATRRTGILSADLGFLTGRS
jgi:glycosyltransferase involved in cell wall biosynthesis